MSPLVALVAGVVVVALIVLAVRRARPRDASPQRSQTPPLTTPAPAQAVPVPVSEPLETGVPRAPHTNGARVRQRPGATFLCSSCLKSFPLEQVRVVPTFEASRQAYLGSYRCDTDWQASLDETRNGFLERAETDLQFEAGAVLAFLVSRGVSRDALREHTAGKMPVDAIMAVFDELEAGRIVLEL